MPDDPISAALDTLAAHTERLAALGVQVGELAALARLLDERITVHGLRLNQLSQPDDDAGEGSYQPAPPRRWWRLAGRDREQAVTALRAWVDQVYRPGYGQIAASLGPCWDQHVLCLYALDILAELWSVLYLSEQRTAGLVSMQAEFQARILPALADQMATETRRCAHRRDPRLIPPTGPVRRTS